MPWKDEAWATGRARKIAGGALDRKKQWAFYVDIASTGEIGQRPELITAKDASEEIERTKRLAEGPIEFSDEYRMLKQILPLVFSNLQAEDLT